MSSMDNLNNRNSKTSVVTFDEDEPLVATSKKSSKLSAILAIGGIGVVAVMAVVGLSYGISQSSSNSHSSNKLTLESENVQVKTSSEKIENADEDYVQEPVEISDKQRENADERMRIVKEITNRVPLIDGHNDFPMLIRLEVDNEIRKLDLRSDLTKVSHTDIPRLRKGFVGGQFWSIYVGCSSQYLDAVQYAMEQIDLVKNMVLQHSDTFQLATSASEIIRAHRSGKIASMMGVEGGHMMGNSLAVLRQLYDLGARYMTLTHQCNTPWGDYNEPEKDTQTRMHNGLTEWGKLVILEMNRLGFMVDLAHVSHKVMADVLDITKAPIIFSHSSAYAVCPHPRNVPDELLRRVKENRGIVMVNFNPPFINCTAENALTGEVETASLSQVADHLEHMKSIVGAEGVGIGSDFDGIPRGPSGLEDVSKFPALLSEMIRRGWSREEMEGLTGANLLRVFREVEKVRDSFKDELPIETPIDYSVIPDTDCRGTPVN